MPNFSRGEVVRWLELQNAYTLHRPLYRKSSAIALQHNKHWRCVADLIELPISKKAKKAYNGYSNLLVIIDVQSKYVWIDPLRDKMNNSVIIAFQYVLAKSERRVPVYLQTGKDKEFVVHLMQKFLKKKDIRFRVTYNLDIKAAIVERFNRTLKEHWTLNVALFYA